MKNAKLSIITVTFNAEDSLEETILSVISQTYKDIEFIIIDGMSTDTTLSIIQKYKDKIANTISERDGGIYHAMNKGIALSTGDYLYFLNSGDRLYSSDTIQKVFEICQDDDVIYGKTALINKDKSLKKITSIPNNLTHKSFVSGMPVSHQSIIIKKSLIEPYDLNYKYVSDQDYIIKALKKAKKIKNSNLIISKYQLGGFSDNNFFGCWRDKFKIVKKHFGLKELLLNYILFVREYLKKIVKGILKIV